MSTTQSTVASVLESALRPVRAQLDLAIEQTTGTAQRSVESAGVLLNQAQALCIEQHNAEVDEFNSLIDHHEALRAEITTKKLQLANLQEQLAEQIVIAKEANASAEIARTRVKQLTSDNGRLAKENNDLKSLNPHALQKQIARLKDDLKFKVQLLDQQKAEMRKARGTAADIKTSLAQAAHRNSVLEDTVEELQSRLQNIDGDVAPVWYSAGDNSGIHFYFYTFGWRLSFGSDDRDVQLQILQDIDWHIEVRTNTGIGVIVSVTEWCRPRYPTLDIFKQSWPEELGSAICTRINELLERSHPHLVRRSEWAESTPLSTLPQLKPQWLDLLNASGLNSLYSVASLTPEELSETVKGFGIATARQVHAACMKTVKTWESEDKQKAA
ncbi:hypothetical protein JFQ86_00570 [Serratia ureilytica]|uniref:hypothetical protein n=1 Tax=Serratia ureilytica TaxID=300181 RepID=UPI0018E908E9|nr:hypothetical protein [Serratia ureilytica]MBJ2111308.1 hypothetical protein [Serratia ureilytica]